MTVDIIDLTSPEYANLNALQLTMVYEAQSRKDKVVAAAKAEKERVIRSLCNNNTVRSTLYQAEMDRIDAETAATVEVITFDLTRLLAYENLIASGNAQGTYSYPSNPNYYLTASERFLVVRNYYMNLPLSAQARLTEYYNDQVARNYLGEYYQTLYDLLASYI